MSTKAIRLVLGKALMEHPITHEEMKAATEAVQAIERAALALDGASIRHSWTGGAWFAQGDELAALNAAADLMQSVAKDAP